MPSKRDSVQKLDSASAFIVQAEQKTRIKEVPIFNPLEAGKKYAGWPTPKTDPALVLSRIAQLGYYSNSSTF
jgi:hypothetical protein